MTRNELVTEFVEKEVKRTRDTWSHHLLILALLVNIICLIKTEPVVVAIFVIGALLGGLSGYKFAFDRIRKI